MGDRTDAVASSSSPSRHNSRHQAARDAGGQQLQHHMQGAASLTPMSGDVSNPNNSHQSRAEHESACMDADLKEKLKGMTVDSILNVSMSFDDADVSLVSSDASPTHDPAAATSQSSSSLSRATRQRELLHTQPRDVEEHVNEVAQLLEDPNSISHSV